MCPRHLERALKRLVTESPLLGTAPLWPYWVRAWANFDGTGVVSFRASWGVASVTDNGAGNYTVNWERTFGNANYPVMLSSTQRNTNVHTAGSGQTATTLNVITDDGANPADASIVAVAAVGVP